MIRKANLKDSPTIIKFNYLMALETEERVLDLEVLTIGVEEVLKDQSKGIYYVYEINQEIIGQLMITKEWSDWRNANFAWIQSVYISKEYRGQKFFKALFEYVRKIIKNDPEYCGLRLYVDKENDTAQKAYHALGMEESNYLLFEL
ncbi:MAG: GNAT family N-acetyltransferase [Bacilli bacterium]|nr:GNAT family N-acetyltransferase [Bacilli bacterium]